MKLYEIKNVGLNQVEDIDTTGNRIILYAARFGNVDSHSDIIHPGAFRKTIAESQSRLKHLWQHDTNKPVGKPESIIEDQNGLLVTSKISKTQLGNDLMILVEDGVMNENSIGFYTIKANKDETKGIRNIHEVQLFEYSSVTWGSNDQAQNIGLKSLTVAEQSNELEKKMSLLEKHLRQGNLSDEMCELLVIQVAQIKSSIAEMLEQSLAVTTEPEIKITLESEEPVEVKSDRDEFADFYSAYIGYNKK